MTYVILYKICLNSVWLHNMSLYWINMVVMAKCFEGGGVYVFLLLCVVAVPLSLLHTVISCSNSGTLSDLATFHLSYCNTSHFSKPQKLVDRCGEETQCWDGINNSVSVAVNTPCVVPVLLPFPPLLLLLLLPRLSSLFVPALLPQWALFWTWKSHIPEGLCGPAALYVSQIDTHSNTHAQKDIQTSTHMPPCRYTLPRVHSLLFWGSSSPLSQHRSSLTLWLSKHGGPDSVVLIFSFFIFFQLMWITIRSVWAVPGRFLLPSFPGNLVRAEATLCMYISKSLCLPKIVSDNKLFWRCQSKSKAER